MDRREGLKLPLPPGESERLPSSPLRKYAGRSESLGADDMLPLMASPSLPATDDNNTSPSARSSSSDMSPLTRTPMG